ncbi:unnamed protein product, partial [Polarella glacialis]
ESDESDDELPPLIGSSGLQVQTPSQAQDNLADNPDDDDDDDDELPPLISSGSATGLGQPSRHTVDSDSSDDELPPLIGQASVSQGRDSHTTPPSSISASDRRPVSDSLSERTAHAGRMSLETATSDIGRASGGQQGGLGGGLGSGSSRAFVPAARATSSSAEIQPTDCLLTSDELSEALMLLDEGHHEEAATLAREALRNAVAAGNAGQEADALRVVAQAKLVAAQKADSRPDSKSLDEVLRVVESDVKSFANRGSSVAEGTMLLAVADVRIAQDLQVPALKAASQALSILEQVSEKTRKAMAHRVLADVYMLMGRSMKALESAKQVFALLGEKPGTELEVREVARACVTAAKATLASQDVVSAIKFSERAGQLFVRLGDQRGASSTACLASCAYLQKPSDGAEEARKAAMRAVALAREAADPAVEAAAWHAAGSAYHMVGNTEEALKATKQALSLARLREVNDLDQIAAALDVIMAIHASDERPERAIVAAEEELQLAKKSGDLRREAFAQQKMAGAMLLQERPREAVRRAQDAAEKLRQAGDRRGEAKAVQLVVELQLQAKRHVEALKAARDAERLLRDLGDVTGLVHVLQMITTLHMDANDNEEALKSARAQRVAYQEAGYSEEEALSQLGVAEMVNSIRGPKEALKAAQESVNLYRAMGDKVGEVNASIQIASYHLGNNSGAAALQVAKAAHALAREQSDPKSEGAALQAVAEAQVSLGRFDEAVSAASQACGLLQSCDDASRARAHQGLAGIQLLIANHDVQQLQARGGVGPRPRGPAEALRASETALKLFRKLGDKASEFAVLQQVVNANLLSQDGSGALRAAREALEVAGTLQDDQSMGSALLAFSQANLLSYNFEEATQALQEATAIFQKIGSTDNANICEQLKQDIQQEKQRRQRPMQPMGRAQSIGDGYGSLLPQRREGAGGGRGQGVPLGGFNSRGVPAGGFGGGSSSQGVPAGGFSGVSDSRGVAAGGFGGSSNNRGVPAGGFTGSSNSQGVPAGGFSGGSSSRGVAAGGFGGGRISQVAASAEKSASTSSSRIKPLAGVDGSADSQSVGGSSRLSSQAAPAGSTRSTSGSTPTNGHVLPAGGTGIGRGPGVPAGGPRSGQGVPAGGFGFGPGGAPAGQSGGTPSSSRLEARGSERDSHPDAAQQAPTGGAEADAPARPTRASRSVFAAFGGAKKAMGRSPEVD